MKSVTEEKGKEINVKATRDNLEIAINKWEKYHKANDQKGMQKTMETVQIYIVQLYAHDIKQLVELDKKLEEK